MVPEGWRASSLLSVLKGSIRNGYSPNPAEKKTGYWILGLGALGDDGIVLDGIKPIEPTQQVLQNLLEPDDFLVSRSNTPDKVGRSLRYKGEIHNCSYPDLLMRFRVDDEKVDLNFMEQTLKSSKVRAYFKTCAAGSSASMVKINKSTVENTPLHLPPLCEQRKIASILSTWDQAITTAEQLLVSSQQLKKALMQRLLTGKRRFPKFQADGGYKKTKYGEIPADWDFVSIASIAKQVSKRNIDGKDYPVLSCSKHYGFVNSLDYFNKKVYSADVSGYKVIERGCFGFPSNHIEEGSIGYQNICDVGIVSPIYIVFKANEQMVDSQFLYALLKTEHYKQIFSAATNASVDRRGSLRWDDFSKIKVQLPSLAEQGAIASVLSAADREIETLQQQLAGLKQEKKALMQQLLTGKRRVSI